VGQAAPGSGGRRRARLGWASRWWSGGPGAGPAMERTTWVEQGLTSSTGGAERRGQAQGLGGQRRGRWQRRSLQIFCEVK
jgi:hypothetical protein